MKILKETESVIFYETENGGISWKLKNKDNSRIIEGVVYSQN